MHAGRLHLSEVFKLVATLSVENNYYMHIIISVETETALAIREAW